MSPAHSALLALASAVKRHDQARHDSDPAAAYASLVECTWWVASLDEHLRKRDGYKTLRDADANGRFVTAIPSRSPSSICARASASRTTGPTFFR